MSSTRLSFTIMYPLRSPPSPPRIRHRIPLLALLLFLLILQNKFPSPRHALAFQQVLIRFEAGRSPEGAPVLVPRVCGGMELEGAEEFVL